MNCLETSCHWGQRACWRVCCQPAQVRHCSVTGSLYFQAAHFLHEEAARYPRKIHYHNPPDLAMEALEVNSLCLCLLSCFNSLFVSPSFSFPVSDANDIEVV